jgi:hypothetical protein
MAFHAASSATVTMASMEFCLRPLLVGLQAHF